METLPKLGISRADMLKRVARFKDLKGSDGGLPDSTAPQCERTLYNVIGFQPPKDSGGAVTSPVGDDASRLSAIPISEGFNLGYCRAKPGKGPMMQKQPGADPPLPSPRAIAAELAPMTATAICTTRVLPHIALTPETELRSTIPLQTVCTIKP
jgi:hypothetical protein